MELKIRNGDYVDESQLPVYIQDICDAIDYAIDSAGTVPLDGPPGRVPLYPYAGEYAASAGSGKRAGVQQRGRGGGTGSAA